MMKITVEIRTVSDRLDFWMHLFQAMRSLLCGIEGELFKLTISEDK